MEKKKEFSKYLENFMKKNGYNLEQISRETGVPVATIGHYKTGRRTPKNDFIDKFVSGFNLNSQEKKEITMAIAIDRTPEVIKDNIFDLKNVKPIKLMEVPLFSSVSAGLGRETIAEPIDFISIPKISGNNIVAILVQGDSMEDTILDGSIVVVNTELMPEIGEIGVFLTKGSDHADGLVKRLKYKNGEYVLESDNKEYDDLRIENSDITLRPHGLQQARPPCPSPTPRVHPNPCPLCWRCHPAISSSVVPFSSCPQCFPASGSFSMSQLFA